MGIFPVLFDIKTIVVMVTRKLIEIFSFIYVFRVIWNINHQLYFGLQQIKLRTLRSSSNSGVKIRSL